MTSATIAIGEHTTLITVLGDDATIELPVGVLTLGERHITADPPLPEQLTNAIGEMLDHVEDAKRELPQLLDASRVVVSGLVPEVIAAVEVGGHIDHDEFALSREAAEDVFRTLATENHAERRRNPGLPDGLVQVIVGGCCVVIGLIRGLQLDGVTVRLTGAGGLDER